MKELEQLDHVVDSLEEELQLIDDLNQLQQKKASYLGKKGVIAQAMANMRDLTIEARKEIGMRSNKIKQMLEERFEKKKTGLRGCNYREKTKGRGY